LLPGGQGHVWFAPMSGHRRLDPLLPKCARRRRSGSRCHEPEKLHSTRAVHEERRMQIRVDDLRGPEMAELLRAHLEHCRKWSPPESVHALDLNALRSPEVTFWTAWDGASLLGCGALKELDSFQGEIKSMHTASKHRGRGVAAGLVTHMVAEARSRSYQLLSLETGSMDAFAPARALYSRFGFISSGPFGDYILDPNSVFMTLDLTNKHIGRSHPK
jgi:putative acetyltransferase